MSTVPYTVVLLKEAPDGPEFFTEDAVNAELDVTQSKALSQAAEMFESYSPRIRLVGIFKGSFANGFLGASSARASE